MIWEVSYISNFYKFSSFFIKIYRYKIMYVYVYIYLKLNAYKILL